VEIKHFIVTRYNLQLAKKLEVLKRNEGWDLGPPDAWMEHRMGLFSKYCYPSVVGQTNQNFTWIILCDPATAPVYRDQLYELIRPNIWFSLFQVDPFEFEEDRVGWNNVLVRINELAEDYEVVLTTRLDNDDALRADYVDIMQTIALTRFRESGLDQLLINMKNGYKYDIYSGEMYSVSMHNSQFQTLIESKKPARTIIGLGNHSTAHERCVTFQMEEAGWMQILHDRNIYNRVKPGDVKTSAELVKRGFVFDD